MPHRYKTTVGTGCALALALVLAVSPADAGQPISVSLTECSAIFNEMTYSTSARSTRARRRKAARASAGFRDAALREARSERVARPGAHVNAWYKRLQVKWRGRFGKPRLLRENLDWISYCRSLGKNRGVLPLRK